MTSQPTTSHHKRITSHPNASHHFTPDDITSHRSITWHQMTWQNTKNHITSNVLSLDMTWHDTTSHCITWHDMASLTFWITATVWIAGSDLVWKLVPLPFLRHLWFLLLVSGNLGPGAWSTDEQISLQWKDSSTIRVLQHLPIPNIMGSTHILSSSGIALQDIHGSLHLHGFARGRFEQFLEECMKIHQVMTRTVAWKPNLEILDLWKKMICEKTTFERFILVEWERSCRIWGNWIVGIRWL